MVEQPAVTLKVVSSNPGKGKRFLNRTKYVTESITMVVPSGEQIKSLKSYRVIREKASLDSIICVIAREQNKNVAFSG